MQAPATVRNVGLFGHGGVGKTTLAESLLYETGVIDRPGRVDDGSSFLDHDPEAVRRKQSVVSTVAPLGREKRLNLLDTPGYFDFAGEARSILRVVEAALLVVDGGAGIQVGTEQAWRLAGERGLPRFIFVGKLDRDRGAWEKIGESLRERFGSAVRPVNRPISGGVESLLEREVSPEASEWRSGLVETAVEGDDELLTRYLDGEEPSPEELRAGVAQAIREGRLVPVLFGSALEGWGVRELAEFLAEMVPAPVKVVAEIPGAGTAELRPDPEEPASALVFKTMADPYVGRLSLFRVFSGRIRSDSRLLNVNRRAEERLGQLFTLKGREQIPVKELMAGEIGAVAKLQETATGETLADPHRPVLFPGISFPRPTYKVAVQAAKAAEEEKLGPSLKRLLEEDPTYRLEQDPDTGELLLAGLGETHLEVLAERLKRKFGVELRLNPPHIPYRETIRKTVRAEGKHKKQSGGHGQYGHVWLEVSPLPNGEFEFVDRIVGGVVPQQYRPAVEKGIREAMAEGILAGYPLTGIRAVLYDGSYHPVDSSEMAFKIAGSLAFKKAAAEALPVLLEPLWEVEVRLPGQFTGDVIGDLNRRRGHVLGIEPEGTWAVIRALVPMAELSRYSLDLRALTQGWGEFEGRFSRYEEAPPQVLEHILASRRS